MTRALAAAILVLAATSARAAGDTSETPHPGRQPHHPHESEAQPDDD